MHFGCDQSLLFPPIFLFFSNLKCFCFVFSTRERYVNLKPLDFAHTGPLGTSLSCGNYFRVPTLHFLPSINQNLRQSYFKQKPDYVIQITQMFCGTLNSFCPGKFAHFLFHHCLSAVVGNNDAFDWLIDKE